MKSFLKLFFFLLLAAVLEQLVSGQDATATLQQESTTDEAVTAPSEEQGTAPESSDTESSSNNPSSESQGDENAEDIEPVQSGPFIDLFGPQLLDMEILDESTGQLSAHYTNEILSGKKVIGLYFSADWCGPCRQFTPELVKFYERMNNRRGKKDQFEIVWISRCRDVNSYVQYFAQMPWIALPPEEAMGAVGQMLGEKYKVKGIPSLVLLDDLGQTITIDARNKIPQDKAGIGFPWRSPAAQLYVTLIPRSIRLMVKSQIDSVKANVVGKIKGIVGLKRKAERPMTA